MQHLALPLPTTATAGLRKWTSWGWRPQGQEVEAEAICGKGQERRKGRGRGAAPTSSAPNRSRRPGGFLQGDPPGPRLPRRPPPASRRDVSDRRQQPCAERAGQEATERRAAHPTSSARAPQDRPRGGPAGPNPLTWDTSCAASAVRHPHAALKPAPPSPWPPPPPDPSSPQPICH